MSSRPKPSEGILSGIRVLDFTWKTVGPWAPRLLAHHGAEVIHVERVDEYDDHRFTTSPKELRGPGVRVMADGKPNPNLSGHFNTLHAGKLAVTINTRHPEGLKLVERLVTMSDAIAENFSAGVFESWGLGWERLHALNPRLVYVSLSGFGHSGEWRGYRSYGPTTQAISGLTHTSGLPGEAPAGWGFSYMDVMGGWLGSTALLMGLLQAKRTGEGCYIDYAIAEGAMSLLGTYFLDYKVNGRSTRRPDFPPGNRSLFPRLAPHNTYRCAGKDRLGQDWWVFIACETQPQFASLCHLMRRPDLLLDSKFATNDARACNEDELDAIVGDWTLPRGRYEIMRLCQAAGIIAAAVQNGEDRVEYDPQLQHRNVYPVVEHPEIGPFKNEGYPIKFSRTPALPHRRGPLHREHTQYVFGDLLKLSDDEIKSFEEQGVI